MADRSFIDHLQSEWASIDALGHELTDDDWAHHTDCPGWTVKDQLSHVVGTESMLLGRDGPPVPRPYHGTKWRGRSTPGRARFIYRRT